MIRCPKCLRGTLLRHGMMDGPGRRWMVCNNHECAHKAVVDKDGTIIREGKP